MSRGAKIALSIGLGFLAALFGMLYLNEQKRQLIGTTEMVRVWSASQDIPANTHLNPDLLVIREVPRLYLQPASITASEIPDKTKVQGITMVPIRQGEQVVRTKLWAGRTPPLSEDMKERKNTLAVSVEIAGLPNALNGLITPGDRVDVLASFQFERANGEKFTEVRPMFQNVEVLALNKTTKTAWDTTIAEDPITQPGESALKTLTLALPPAAAQQIVLAQQLGTIWFLLRAEGDGERYNYEAWNNERLLQSPHRLWEAEQSSIEQMVRSGALRR